MQKMQMLMIEGRTVLWWFLCNGYKAVDKACDEC